MIRVKFKKKGNKVIAILTAPAEEDFMNKRFMLDLRCLLFELQYGRMPCLSVVHNELYNKGHAIVRCNKSAHELILEYVNKYANEYFDSAAKWASKGLGKKYKKRKWCDYTSMYKEENQIRGLSCYGLMRFDMYTGPSYDYKAAWGEHYIEIENVLNK